MSLQRTHIRRYSVVSNEKNITCKQRISTNYKFVQNDFGKEANVAIYIFFYVSIGCGS
jgi:hypothetical protein